MSNNAYKYKFVRKKIKLKGLKLLNQLKTLYYFRHFRCLTWIISIYGSFSHIKYKSYKIPTVNLYSALIFQRSEPLSYCFQ